MSELLVTTNQTDAVGKMANEKKVGRAKFQQALDDGRVSRFLDEIKMSGIIIPPDNTYIHVVRVKVKLDQPWNEAVDMAGPDTPDHYNVRKVGNLYLPTGTGEEEQEHILLNYPLGGGSLDKALAWAREKGLKRTVPREVFAIGRENSNLHIQIGQDPMYVVATTPCTFEDYEQACYVWWSGSEREANLFWVSYFDDASDWFAFRKLSALGTQP